MPRCSRSLPSFPRLIVPLLVVFAVATTPVAAADLTQHTMRHDGIERSYSLYVPAAVREAGQPAPLLIALHDGGGRAAAFAEFTGFNALADTEGFVVAYPEGIERHWNDGRSRVGVTTLVRNTDDVGFLVDLVREISATRVPVETGRVFVTGFAEGGMMAWRAACDAADRFAAVGVVAANLSVRMRPRCAPAQPVSVMAVNGNNDRVMPWRGGDLRLGFGRQVRVMGAEDTVAFWAERNRCAADPVEEPVPGAGNDTRTTRVEYRNCEDSRVVFYKVDRGGHTWPGSEHNPPESAVGKTSRDFDASRALWEFFASAPPRQMK